MQHELLTEFSTELKHLCNRFRSISVSLRRNSLLWIQASLQNQVPGTAHSRTGQSWGNVARATASTWFRSGWFQRLLYQGCHPCLAASGYCACSRDMSNSRDAHNWSFNYYPIQFNTANSEVLRLGGDTSTLLPHLHHKPRPSSRVRAEQQDNKPLEKN